MPELFAALRGVIDRGRRKGKGIGRFLILGSASIDLLRQSGETLAGRIAYIDMAPFSALEVEDVRAARERLWLRGGFPESYLASSDQNSLALRRDFIRTYLERDVATFGPRVPATTLERLWTMLAHRQGTTLNVSALARGLRRGFHLASEDIQPTRAFVVHAGDDRYPVAQGVEGIGVRELAEALRERG